MLTINQVYYKEFLTALCEQVRRKRHNVEIFFPTQQYFGKLGNLCIKISLLIICIKRTSPVLTCIKVTHFEPVEAVRQKQRSL